MNAEFQGPFQPQQFALNGICQTNSPWLNGGYCRNLNSTSYVCMCPPGWTSTNCEVQIDFCNPNPCQNGASCSKVGYLDYACSCSTKCGSNYAGKNCQLLNYCSSSPCLNGGECLNRNSTFACLCPPGFTGSTCGTAIDYCSPNPCQNGGTCQKWGFFSNKCSCSPSYSGNVCQYTAYATSSACSSACKGKNCVTSNGVYYCPHLG